MSISDEELMAYIDGELDAGRRTVVDERIAADADFGRRVAAQRALRDRLRRGFDRTLEEPVPPTLLEAARRASTMSQVDSSAARLRSRRRFTPTTWLAAAASLVLGLFAGSWLVQLGQPEPGLAMNGSRVAAGSELARALSATLASEPTGSQSVRVGISFVANSGNYCRTFVASEAAGSLAGIACREPDAWRVIVLQSNRGSAASGSDYRQAATSLPPLVLESVQANIRGEPLDAAAEAAARARDWQRPAP